jgi:hypothetical protein
MLTHFITMVSNIYSKFAVWKPERPMGMQSLGYAYEIEETDL